MSEAPRQRHAVRCVVTIQGLGGEIVGATPRDRRAGRPTATLRPALRGPIRRDEWVRRVREALRADYTVLRTSPLCDLPGVQALAHSDFSRRIYPTAAAVRVLLDRAYDAAVKELDGVADRRIRQVATYLQLAREGLPVIRIAQQLGLRSRSYVHRAIQRQALDLITEAFLQLARQSDASGDTVAGAPAASRAGVLR